MFYKRRPDPPKIDFSRHSDVLQRMARSIVKRMINYLDEKTNYYNGGNFECTSTVYIYDYYGNKTSMYIANCCGFRFEDYGMQSIPENTYQDFMDALCPYVKAEVDRLFMNTKAHHFQMSVLVYRGSYEEREFDWHKEEYVSTYYPAIEISIRKKVYSPAKTLTPW